MKTVKLNTSILLEGKRDAQAAGTVHALEDAQADGLIAQGYAKLHKIEGEGEGEQKTEGEGEGEQKTEQKKGGK